MNPELEHDESLVREHPLVLPDRGHLRVELAVAELAAHARGQRLVVPRVHEDADLAFRRQRAPITPCGRVRFFLRRGRTERQHADVAGIHPRGELIRGFAAAAALDAGDEHKHGTAPGLRQIVLRVEERLAQLRFLALVFLLRYPVTDLRGFEHAGLSYFDGQNGFAALNRRSAFASGGSIAAACAATQPRTAPAAAASLSPESSPASVVAVTASLNWPS